MSRYVDRCVNVVGADLPGLKHTLRLPSMLVVLMLNHFLVVTVGEIAGAAVPGIIQFQPVHDLMFPRVRILPGGSQRHSEGCSE